MSIDWDKLDRNDMSTARELATHAADIKHLQADMDKIVSDMDEVKKTLEAISITLSEARGGWRILMAVGGSAGIIGSGLTWLIQHWGK